MTDTAALTSALRTVAWRLPPLLALLLLISVVDQTSVTLAAPEMSMDVGFEPAVYDWGVGFFFLSYVLFATPSNVALDRIGARRWIAPLAVAAGLATIATAWVEGPRTLFFLRFLFGMAEAGLLPGMLLYLSDWLPARRRALALALLLAALPLAQALGAPLARWLLENPRLQDALGLTAWQWLFIIEGAATIVVGALVYPLTADRPDDAGWLKPSSSAALKSELEREFGDGPIEGDALIDGILSAPALWLGLANFGLWLVIFGVGALTPEAVAALNLPAGEAEIAAALPFVAAALTMLALGLVGDATGRRTALTIAPLLLAAAGLFASAIVANPYLAYAALALAACGVYGALPAFWTLPSYYFGGRSAASGFAVIHAIGVLGALACPYALTWIRAQHAAFGADVEVLSVVAPIAALIVAGLAMIRRAARA